MYDSHNIAISIKQRAKAKNVVIKIMLEELNLGSNTMSAMYHGKTIASDSLTRIADYLDCFVDYLLVERIIRISTSERMGISNRSVLFLYTTKSRELDCGVPALVYLLYLRPLIGHSLRTVG